MRPPFLEQLRRDRRGLAAAARSKRPARLEPRTATADRVVKSICPYCAVGCGQSVYVKGDRVVQIEGDEDSPISRGRRCPRGSSSLRIVELFIANLERYLAGRPLRNRIGG